MNAADLTAGPKWVRSPALKRGRRNDPARFDVQAQGTPRMRACPTCGTTIAIPWSRYSPTPWVVAKCVACNLTYLRNPVPYEALEEDFAWEKIHVEKRKLGGSTPLSATAKKLRTATIGIHRDKTRAYMDWFGRAGHVLDIGCGSRPRAPEPIPYGIEISRSLQAQADAAMRARGGYCVYGAGTEAIWDFDEGQFDGIIMFSYLEHETDVMRVLRGAHHALKSGGAAFVRVPNFGSLNRRVIGPKWCGFRYPDHVNYFTLATLRDTAWRAGFTATLLNRFTLPVDDNLSVLLRKATA